MFGPRLQFPQAPDKRLIALQVDGVMNENISSPRPPNYSLPAAPSSLGVAPSAKLIFFVWYPLTLCSLVRRGKRCSIWSEDYNTTTGSRACSEW